MVAFVLPVLWLKGWFYFQSSQNEEVICHKFAWCSRNGTAVLMGVRLSAFYRNSVSCVYLARFVTKFGTRTDEQQISPFAPIRLREMALVEMKGCGVLACAECLRWRRREVMISTARVREVGEYSVGEYRMTSPSHDRPC